MVQEFYVLRCFSCCLFQVQIIKKVNKWICKVCGVKQSVTKVYSQGSSKDCRQHVQKLNAFSQNNCSKTESYLKDSMVLNDDFESSLHFSNDLQQNTKSLEKYVKGIKRTNSKLTDCDDEETHQKKIKSENRNSQNKWKLFLPNVDSRNNFNVESFEPDVSNKKEIALDETIKDTNNDTNSGNVTGVEENKCNVHVDNIYPCKESFIQRDSNFTQLNQNGSSMHKILHSKNTITKEVFEKSTSEFKYTDRHLNVKQVGIINFTKIGENDNLLGKSNKINNIRDTCVQKSNQKRTILKFYSDEDDLAIDSVLDF